MRDFVDLGITAPPMEGCAQVGSRIYDYSERARREAKALIAQLRRICGVEPEHARLTLKGHAHDFGTYYTVVCYYETDDVPSAAYAQLCDERCPQEWDDAARQSLRDLAAKGGV